MCAWPRPQWTRPGPASELYALFGLLARLQLTAAPGPAHASAWSGNISQSHLTLWPVVEHLKELVVWLRQILATP